MSNLPSWDETEEIENKVSDLPSWDATEEIGGVADQVEGVVKGLGKGTAIIDELAAVGDTAINTLANLPVSQPSKIIDYLSKTPERYNKSVERFRADQEQAEEKAPTAFKTGEILGAVGSGLAVPASKAGILGKAGASALEGAAYGFASGEGGIQERLEDAATGGALGGLGSVALSGLGKGVEKVMGGARKPLQTFAENQTLKSVGATGQDLVKKNNRKFVEEAAKEIHEEGINKLALTGNEDKILSKVTSKLKQIGEEVGDLKQGLDESIGRTLDSNKIKNILMDEVGDLPNLSGNRPMIKLLDDVSGDIDIVAEDGVLGLADLWRVRDSVGKRAGWDKSKLSLSDENMLARDLYHKVNKVVSDIIDNTADDSAVVGELKKLNSKYNIYSKLKGYASSNKMKTETRSFVPFKSLTAGALGGAASVASPLGAAVGFGANALREKYGQQALARSATSISNMLERASSKTPALNKYKSVLEQASPSSRRIMINTLLRRNKDFKEEYEKLKSENKED